MTDGGNSRVSQIVARYPIRITRNHGFPSARLIELVKPSLDPLFGGPVPATIIIRNIVIAEVSPNNLAISCDVIYVS